MGLCFDPRDEQKLARGWPNVIAPVDGHPHDKRAAKAALKAHAVSDPIYFTEWPRETLARYLRIEAACAGAATAKTYDARQQQIADAAEKAANDDAPPSAKDALAALHDMFERSDEIYPFQSYAFVYGVETIAGTDAVIEAIAKDLDALTLKAVTSAKINMTSTLAFLSMRASPAAGKRVRAILSKAYKRHSPHAEEDSDIDELVDVLDACTNGTTAVRRLTADPSSLDGEMGLIGRPWIEYTDDAALVRKVIANTDGDLPMSVRVAWLAGEGALEGLSSRKWSARRMPSVVRDFGMFRSPHVVDFMLSLVGKTSVKDAPLQWFKAHAEYCEPLLAKSKVAVAKTILRQLR